MKNPVAVFNNDHQTYSEVWREVNYTIPSGKAIVMARRDANNFVGSYGGADPHDPTRPKTKALVILPVEKAKGKIVGEYEQSLPDEIEQFICQLDGTTYPDQLSLDTHLATLKDRVYRDERLDKAAPTDEVKCPFCLKAMKGKAGLKIHLSHCTGAEDDNSTESHTLESSPTSSGSIS